MTQVAPQPARRDRRDPGHGSRALPPREDSAFPPPRPTAPPVRLRGRHATGYDQGFAGVVAWTIVGSVLPGAGLVAAGRRTAGWFLLVLTGLLGLALAAFVLFGDLKRTALSLVFDTDNLMRVAVALVVGALLWAFVVLGSHVSLRRFTAMTGGQRLLSTTLVTAIIAGGGLVAAKAASYTLITRETLQDVSRNGTQITNGAKPDTAQADPWAKTPRVNVLLIGSDAGADRKGVRTDSVILASIDTKTGDAVLFGIPRNLQSVPFPEGTPMAAQYPNGFYCPERATTNPCLFNALWQYGVENASNSYYKQFKNPGLQATMDGVKAVTGLAVDEYVLLDLKGFASFINAMGGVDVTVKRPIPVAGREDANGREYGVKKYIQPGRQHLDGYLALWFARSRSDSSDYDRMARQRCLIGAVTQQADPLKLAQRFPALAAAIRKNISMSIAVKDLSAWAELATRVQKGQVRSLPFVEGLISTVHPDFDRMHEWVQKALTAPPKKSTSTPTKKPTAKPGTGSTGTAPSSKAVDVKDTCG